MQRTKDDAIRFPEAAASRAEAPTRSLRGRARPRVAAREAATRRYHAQELARIAPLHATETVELGRSLPAYAQPYTGDLRPPPSELADLLEPELVITWGLRARMKRLAQRVPAAAIAFLVASLMASAIALAVRGAAAPLRVAAGAAATSASTQRELPGSARANANAAATANGQPATKPDPLPHDAAQAGATPAEAVDLLARGRYADALDRYEQLARAQPAQPAYAAVCAILRRKLATYCAQQRTPGDDTCRAAP